MRGRQTAFTLIEMSVVLGIIGVIAGGIMFGRAMMVTSQLQTMLTDADNYITATGNFKQAYMALPGDMANATTLWGTDSLTCPYGGGATGTCNGDGDGRIANFGSTGHENETFRFWQQLRLASMFNQNLTGAAVSGTGYNCQAGLNVPAGSLPGSAFFMVWLGTQATGTEFNAGTYGNSLIAGGINSTTACAVNAVFTPDQASSLDAKVDDGMPASGKIRSLNYTSTYEPNCTQNTSPLTYNLTYKKRACGLIFITGY